MPGEGLGVEGVGGAGVGVAHRFVGGGFDHRGGAYRVLDGAYVHVGGAYVVGVASAFSGEGLCWRGLSLGGRGL